MSHLRLTEEQLAARAKRLATMQPLPVDLPPIKITPKGANKVRVVPCPSESDEQITVIDWCNLHPVAKRIASIPNGLFTTKASAGRAKAEGLRAGFPDLILMVPRDQFHGLAIELKRKRGGKVSPEQVDWLAFLTSQGYYACICLGADEAIAKIKEYLDAP